MPTILQLPLTDFLAQTAAKQPTPGGGSVAALCGALAAALAAMAMEYTLGKKAYAQYGVELRASLAHFQNAAAMLQELITEDIAAYAGLSALLKLPEPERLAHPDYVPSVVAAIRSPQTAAGFAMNILSECTGLLDKTNKFLVSDLGIAAVYAHATVHASELNVRVNLPLLPNPAEAVAVRDQMAELSAKADRVYTTFRHQLLTRM